MLVSRRTLQIGMVPTEDAVALLKEALQWAPAGVGPIRVYTSSIGTMGKIGVEVELQSLADYERFWNGWRAKAPPEWWERWNRVIEPGGSDEVWTVVV